MPPPRPDPETSVDAALTLAALRACGAKAVDPVRFGYLEALARRAATRQGEVRQVLDDKLARALAAYGARCPQAPSTPETSPERAPDRAPGTLPDPPVGAHYAPPPCGPLGRLVQHIDSLAALPRACAPDALPAAPQHELKALAAARGTWTRLSAERHLIRSLAQVPDNPGPLNSHRLVLRSLQLMQSISPAYLEHFIAQAEALLWLEQVAAADDAAAPPARRDGVGKPKKTVRGRSAVP